MIGRQTYRRNEEMEYLFAKPDLSYLYNPFSLNEGGLSGH